MGGLADAAGIQFRILNRSRGPAVWGPRAQCDRALYARLARAPPRSDGEPDASRGHGRRSFTSEGGRVRGALTADGGRIAAGAVVVTTGTFLNGLMHTGRVEDRGRPRRRGRPRAASRARSRARARARPLQDGHAAARPSRLGRLRRVRAAGGRRSARPVLVPHEGRFPARQALCWLTATNPRVHALIREHLHESPMYSGQIHGIGPRYCPSVEDKVVKFADKAQHTIFLEPDGWRFRGDLHQRALDLAARRGPARDPRGRSRA